MPRCSAANIDVLYVMSPANLNYLTGFESIWYPPRAPLGAIVRAADPGIVFVDYERHRNHALNAAHWDETVFVDYSSALDTVFSVFADRGWTRGSVGIEWHTVAPSGPLVSALAAGLAERGAEIVDGDWVVDRVRLVKSPAEVACVRRASEIADGAFEQLPEIVRPGMTEIEIAARLDLAMAELGGEHAGVRTMVSAGPLVWCQTHFAPTRRPVEVGDIMYIDACGVYNRYHVDVCRTYAIGEDNAQAREMLDYTAQSVEKVREAVRPGDPLEVAQRIAEEHVFARFSRDQVWWVGGYALGIAFPPSWVGHTYIANDAYEKFTWEPGYVTNYENIVFDAEAGITASYMETLMMTETGIEILSRSAAHADATLKVLWRSISHQFHHLVRTAERRRRLRLIIGSMLIFVAVLMVPWTVYLAATLPTRHHAAHWDAVWVGFDVALVFGIVTTALGAFRRVGLAGDRGHRHRHPVSVRRLVRRAHLHRQPRGDRGRAASAGGRVATGGTVLLDRVERRAGAGVVGGAQGPGLTPTRGVERGPESRLGRLALGPQHRQRAPRQRGDRRVHQVSRLPPRRELGVESLQPLDLEPAIGDP